MTISIQLPADAERNLIEVAERLQVPVAELAVAALRDFVSGPAADFEQAASRVLEQHRELYRPLA